MARKLFQVSGHHSSYVNDAIYVDSDKAVITVSDDKSMMLWLQRSDGQFWPSVHQTLLGDVSALIFDQATRRLFVGTGQGTILEYQTAPDFNSATHNYTINAHTGRVEAIVLDKVRNTLVSISRDKSVRVHNASGGAVFASLALKNVPSSIQYDQETLSIFVGDVRGTISVLRLEGTVIRELSVLAGHSATVSSLFWDSKLGVLISGSHDSLVMVWDIGGGQGNCFELHGHSGKVQGVYYLSEQKKIISAGQDGIFIVWDMLAPRLPTPDWKESDKCEICEFPFLWNVKQMFAIKSLSVSRQHHCRKCGAAVCHSCSSTTSTLTRLGFELPVRVCKNCAPEISPDERKPYAKFFHATNVYHMSVWASNPFMVTCNTDYSVSVWDISAFLEGGGFTAEEFKKAPRTYATAASSSKATGQAKVAAPVTVGVVRPKQSGLLASVLDDDDDHDE